MDHVYLISFEDPRIRKINPYVKIGISYNSNKRISGMQTGSPLKLKVFGFIEHENSRQIESFLHKLFIHERIYGEWFKISLGLIDAIKTRYQVQEDLLHELMLELGGVTESMRIKELEHQVACLKNELKFKNEYISKCTKVLRKFGLLSPVIPYIDPKKSLNTIEYMLVPKDEV